MPGMADSLNVMGQEDAASNIMTINGPQGPMQIDISGMMPEDAEMIMAVARDAEEAGDPETQAQMMQLLQELMAKSHAMFHCRASFGFTSCPVQGLRSVTC